MDELDVVVVVHRRVVVVVDERVDEVVELELGVELVCGQPVVVVVGPLVVVVVVVARVLDVVVRRVVVVVVERVLDVVVGRVVVVVVDEVDEVVRHSVIVNGTAVPLVVVGRALGLVSAVRASRVPGSSTPASGKSACATRETTPGSGSVRVGVVSSASAFALASGVSSTSRPALSTAVARVLRTCWAVRGGSTSAAASEPVSDIATASAAAALTVRGVWGVRARLRVSDASRAACEARVMAATVCSRRASSGDCAAARRATRTRSATPA